MFRVYSKCFNIKGLLGCSCTNKSCKKYNLIFVNDFKTFREVAKYYIATVTIVAY